MYDGGAAFMAINAAIRTSAWVRASRQDSAALVVWSASNDSM
jgi:hypothetical protein